VFLAAGLAVMGLLGISSLVVTIATMPQIERLRQVGGLLTSRFDAEDDDREGREDEASEPRIDWQTTDQHRDEQTGKTDPDGQAAESRRGRASSDDQQEKSRAGRDRADKSEAQERTGPDNDRETGVSR
jgi:hypothetical protein